MIRLILVSLSCVASAAALACPPLLQHTFRTLQGQPFDFCALEGKAVLVVNTASKCGFTPQFETLEKMYAAYQKQGLVVVGFPSNDFFQELDSNEEVASFCRLTYSVQFPMMEKTRVRGSDANPLFRQLAEATGDSPLWNFHKYLIAPDGKTVFSFGTRTRPDSAEVMKVLRPMLVQPAPAAKP